MYFCRTVYQSPCRSRGQRVAGRLRGSQEGGTAAGNPAHLTQSPVSEGGSQGPHSLCLLSTDAKVDKNLQNNTDTVGKCVFNQCCALQ